MFEQSDTSICSEVAAGGEVSQKLSVTTSITVQNAGDTIEGNCADVTVLHETIRPTSPVSTEGIMEPEIGQEEEGNNEHFNQAEASDLDPDRNVSPLPAVCAGSDGGFGFATKVVSEDYIDDFVESPSLCAGLSSEENINAKESICVIADDDTVESKPDVVDDENVNDVIEKYEDVEELNTTEDQEEELDISDNIDEKENIDADKEASFIAEISDDANDKVDDFSVSEEGHVSPDAEVGVDNKEERVDGSIEDDKINIDGGYHDQNMVEDYTDNSEEDNVVAVNIEQDVGLSEVENEIEKDEDAKSVRDDDRSNKDDHVTDDGGDAVKDKADSETKNDDVGANKEDGVNDDNVADDEDSDANANKEDANDGSHSSERQTSARARGRLLRRSSPSSRPAVVDYGVPDETSGEFFDDEDLEFVMALEPDHFQEVNPMPLRAEFVAQSPPPAVMTVAPFNPASQSRSSPTVAIQPEHGPTGSSSEHTSPTIANITHSVTPASDVVAQVDENEEATPVQLDSHEALLSPTDGLEIMNSQDACIVDTDPTGLKWPATQPEPTGGNKSSSPVIASPNDLREPVEITSAKSIPSSHQDLPNDDRIPSIIKRAACVPEVTLTNNEIPSNGDPNETKTLSPETKACVQSEEVYEDSEALASAENDFKNIESLDEAEPVIDQRERTDQDADLLLDQVINGKADKSMGPNNTGRALGPMSGPTDFEDADMEESALANDSQEQNSTQATEDTEEQCLCKKRLSSSSFVISGESCLADVSKEGSTSSLIGGTENNIDEDLAESIAKKVSPCVSNHDDMDELNDRWNTDEEISVDDRLKDSSSHELQNMSQVNANENLNKDCSEVLSFLQKNPVTTNKTPLCQHEDIERYADGDTEIEIIGETEQNYAECKDVIQSLHDLHDNDNDDNFFREGNEDDNDEGNRVECDDVNTGFDTDPGACDPDSCIVLETEEIKQTMSSSSSCNVKDVASNYSCNEQKEQPQSPDIYDNDNILDNDDGELDVANHESSAELDLLKENATFDELRPEDSQVVQEIDEAETEPDVLNVGSLSRTSIRSDTTLEAVKNPDIPGSGFQKSSLSNENLTDLMPNDDALTRTHDQGIDIANQESSTELDPLEENITFDELQPEDNPVVQEKDGAETEPAVQNVGSLSRTSLRSEKSFALGAVENPNRSSTGLQNASPSNENVPDLRPQDDPLFSAGDQGIDEFDSNESPKHETQNISSETEANLTPENKEEDVDYGKEEASAASSDESVTRSGHENEAEIANVESEDLSEVIDVVEKAQGIKDPCHETISPNEEDIEQLGVESNTDLAIFKTKSEDSCANDESLKVNPQDGGQETSPLQEDILEKNELLSIPETMSSPGSDEISKDPKEVSERGEALSEIGDENEQVCGEEESFAQLNCDQVKLAPSNEALFKLDDECVEINRYLVELNCETLAVPESSEKQKNADNIVSSEEVNDFDDARNKTMTNSDDKDKEINQCFDITQVDNETCAENVMELNHENAEMSKSDEKLLNINPDAVHMNGSEKEMTKVNSNTFLKSKSSEGLKESESEIAEISARAENVGHIDTESEILETNNHVESDSDEGPTGINNENNKDLITCDDPILQFGGGKLTTTTIDENLPTMVNMQPTATTVDAESLKHLIEVDNIVCVNPTEKDTNHLCQIAMSNCCTYSPELGDMETNETYVLTADRVQSSPENKESQNSFKVSSPCQINDDYVQEDKELYVDEDRSDDDEDKVRNDNLQAEQEEEFSPWETDNEDRISDVNSELGADVEEMDDDENYDYDDGAGECVTRGNEIGDDKETIIDTYNDEKVDEGGDFKPEENVPDVEISLENQAEIKGDDKETIIDTYNHEKVDEGGDFKPEENVPDVEISLENQAELKGDDKETIIDTYNHKKVDEGGDFKPEENVPDLDISLENQAEINGDGKETIMDTEIDESVHNAGDFKAEENIADLEVSLENRAEIMNVDGKETFMDSNNDESEDEGGDFEPEENVSDLEVSLENQAEINGDGLTEPQNKLSRIDDIEQEDVDEKKRVQLVEDEKESMDSEEIGSNDDKVQKLLVMDEEVMEEDVMEEDQEYAPDKCPSDTESGHDDLKNVSLIEEMSVEKKIETGDEVENDGMFQSFDKPQEMPPCLDEEVSNAESESVCGNSIEQIKFGENIPEHANKERGNGCDESDTSPSHVIYDNVAEESTCTTIDDLSWKQEGQGMRSPEPTPPDTSLTFNIEKEADNFPESHLTEENIIDGADTVFFNKEDNAEVLCDVQQSDSCFAVGEINKDLFMTEVDPSLQVASTNTTVFVAEKQPVDTVVDEFDPERQATPFEQSGAPLRQQLSPASKVILDNTDVWLNKISDFCKSPALALDEPNKDLQLQNLAAQCKSEIVSLSRCQDVCADNEPNESTSLNDTPDDLPRSTTSRRRLKRVSNASSQHSVLGDEYVPRPPDSARSSRPQSSRSNASSQFSVRHRPGASYSISEKGSIGHNTPEEIDSHPSLASVLTADNKLVPEMLKQNNLSATNDRPSNVQKSQSIQNSESSRELNLKTSGEETLDDISTCPSLAGSSFHIASYARANCNAREEQVAAPSTQPQRDTIDQLRSKSVEGPSIVPDNAPRAITERRRCVFKASATLPKILRQNDPRNGSQVFQPHPPNTMNSTQTDSRPPGRSRLALRSRLLRVGTVSPEAKGDGSPKKVGATSKFDKVLGPRKKTERKSLSPARTSVDAGQRRLRVIPTGDSVPGVSHLSRQKMEPLKLPGQKKPPKPKINKMMTMAEFERAQADKHLNQAFARVNSSKPYVDCHMDAKIMEKTGGSVKRRRERVNYNSLIAVENIKFLEVLQYKRSSYDRDEQMKNFQKTFKSMVHLGK